MQPTPVEVHQLAAPWNDLASPAADLDDAPSPRSAAEMIMCAGVQCAAGSAGLSLAVSLLTDQHQPLLTDRAQLHYSSVHPLSTSCDSFADSFDDDTVVSFDDLSEVVTTSSSANQQRYVASAPPPIIDSHAHHSAAAQFTALEGPF